MVSNCDLGRTQTKTLDVNRVHTTEAQSPTRADRTRSVAMRDGTVQYCNLKELL